MVSALISRVQPRFPGVSHTAPRPQVPAVRFPQLLALVSVWMAWQAALSLLLHQLPQAPLLPWSPIHWLYKKQVQLHNVHVSLASVFIIHKLATCTVLSLGTGAPCSRMELLVFLGQTFTMCGLAATVMSGSFITGSVFMACLLCMCVGGGGGAYTADCTALFYADQDPDCLRCSFVMLR